MVSCLISLFNVKYGRQRKLNYTSIPSAFSLAKKYNLLLKRLNCGHVTSRSRSGDNHVVGLNCKISFIGLVVQYVKLWHTFQKDILTRIYLRELQRQTKTNSLWIVLNYAM